jgi:hypothetical protein
VGLSWWSTGLRGDSMERMSGPPWGFTAPPLPTDKALVAAYKHELCRAQALAFKRDLPMFLVYCHFEMAQK